MWVLVVYMAFGYNGGMTSIGMLSYEVCEKTATAYTEIENIRFASCVNQSTGDVVVFRNE